MIVTDCATCGSKLKEYGEILADDPEWAERAASFSSKVKDVSEFLMSIPLEKPTGHVDARVTYHDPCHLRRAQGVWKEPRALLKMIDGVEFVELPEADMVLRFCRQPVDHPLRDFSKGNGPQGQQPGNPRTPS